MDFKIRVIQNFPQLGDIDRNFAVHCEDIKKAIKDQIDLIVFPELSLTGYLLKDMVPVVAVHKVHPIIEELQELSKKISILIGLVEESDSVIFYNSAFYFEDGLLKFTHRKVYLPTYGMFEEERYFGSGDKIRAFDTKFGRFGVAICEDAWHPSLIYALSQDRIKYLFILSSSPGRGFSETGERFKTSEIWETLIRTYAMLFSNYVVFANRSGVEDGVSFWGGSEIIDPSGESVLKLPYFEESFGDYVLEEDNIRRVRMYSPLLRDEKLGLTLKELKRIYDNDR
ncbi:MAG: hypothetical protein PHV06_02195 [bacterium]|nr:hypothetical protein [bacterium]